MFYSIILVYKVSSLTHWCVNEIDRDPLLIPWPFLEYFRASESTKINHMRSNNIHKIRFHDIVYLKLTKWRVKILKNIIKKNSTWCVKLMRKQEIILFPYRATKCPTEAEKIEYSKMSYWLWRTNWNQIQQNFHSCTLTANIWENNGN